MTTSELADFLPAMDARHAREFTAPRATPLLYPGVKPGCSFLVVHDKVLPIRVAKGKWYVKIHHRLYELNDYLVAHNAEPMETRVPVIGYGSNGCPGQLSYKFTHAQDTHGDLKHDADRAVIPTIRGVIKDVVPVHSSMLASFGYMMAELYPEAGALSEVYINFLSRDQLRCMVRSEGKEYALCQLGYVTLEGLDLTIPAYGFAGKMHALFTPGRQPLKLEEAATLGSRLHKRTQKEVLKMLANRYGHLLNHYYPHVPFMVHDAPSLAAFRRYEHHHPSATLPDAGSVLQSFLHQEGLTGHAPALLQRLPVQYQNIIPQQFGALV